MVGRMEIFSQFDLMETRGGQLAVKKMLARIRRGYWWPTMRTDIERKVQGCLSRAVQMTMKTKRAQGLAPFDPGNQILHVGSRYLGTSDNGNEYQSKPCAYFDEIFHNVLDCSSSGVDRFC